MSKQKVGLLGIFVFVLGSVQGNLSAAAERVMTARELREAARQGGQAMYTRSGARLRAAADARAALAGMSEKEKEALKDEIKILLDDLEVRVNAFADKVRRNPAKRNEIFAELFNEIKDKNAEWSKKDIQGAGIPPALLARFDTLRATLADQNRTLEGVPVAPPISVGGPLEKEMENNKKLKLFAEQAHKDMREAARINAISVKKDEDPDVNIDALNAKLIKDVVEKAIALGLHKKNSEPKGDLARYIQDLQQQRLEILGEEEAGSRNFSRRGSWVGDEWGDF